MLSMPLLPMGCVGVLWSRSCKGRAGPACAVGGVAALRGLIAANPVFVGALTEANPDEVVVGGGLVS